MGISKAVYTKLYSFAGNQCAFPGCAEPLFDFDRNTGIGEICHIKAQRPNGPRYDGNQSEQDRHSFENLIILCRNHHKMIDATADLEKYPVHVLVKMKRDHESEVRNSGGTLPHQKVSKLLATLPFETIPDIGNLPAASRMPHAPNPLFVGRQAILKGIATALKGQGTSGQNVVLTGVEGVGKSQLAVEFAHRYGQYFTSGVFWLSFAKPETVPAEIGACGSAALHPDYASLSLAAQIESVQKAWRSARPRLLIFDHCEDDELFVRWAPKTGGYRLLITSRSRDWDPTLGVQALQLGLLAREQSIRLLCKTCPRLKADDPALDVIAQTLGDLPSALESAGRFLKRYPSIEPADYFKESAASLKK